MLTPSIPHPRRALPPHAADTRPVGRLVARIAAAARAGERCPTNAALADALGYAKPETICTLLRKAELQQLIRVERGPASRVVTAFDGSWRTAGAITTPHWRDQRAGRA